MIEVHQSFAFEGKGFRDLAVATRVTRYSWEFNLFDRHYLPSCNVESKIYPCIAPFAQEFSFHPLKGGYKSLLARMINTKLTKPYLSC